MTAVAGDAEPPSWRELTRTWLAFIALLLATATVVAVVAPDWLDGPTRELPDRAGLIADIAVNNLLIAAIPLFGGWLAAAHRRRGRRLIAVPFLVFPAVIVGRSVVTVGAVGGADPAWLLDASRWWLLEWAALATATHTGLWIARHPAALDDARAPRAMRRAVAVVLATVTAGALVEVLTA